MHVIAISAISDQKEFDKALKKAYSRLPKGAKWKVAVASADQARMVNIIVHDSVDGVRSFFEEHTGSFATTEFFEADATNAVGLPK